MSQQLIQSTQRDTELWWWLPKNPQFHDVSRSREVRVLAACVGVGRRSTVNVNNPMFTATSSVQQLQSAKVSDIRVAWSETDRWSHTDLFMFISTCAATETVGGGIWKLSQHRQFWGREPSFSLISFYGFASRCVLKAVNFICELLGTCVWSVLLFHEKSKGRLFWFLMD